MEKEHVAEKRVSRLEALRGDIARKAGGIL
jgi:hypothetical protein